MDKLIFGMILAGSILMVYNIIRYAAFIKRNSDLEKGATGNGVNIVPLLLLIFFLIGYLIVGISGIADVLIASILLGGSIFVFLLLLVMYSIVGHIRDTERILATRYEEIKQEMSELMKDSYAMLRVNLTKDEIEERGGDYLYDSDLQCDKYSDLVEARREYIIDNEYDMSDGVLFTRSGLLQYYNEGMTNASKIVLARRKDGEISFVKYSAVLTKKPVSGDVVAFIVESPYNEDVVRKTMFEKVILDEYDRIAYIIEGKYKTVISDTAKKDELLLKDDIEDTYESIYFNYILPAMSYDREKNEGRPNPLRLSTVEKELSSKDLYEVDAPFTINGERHYKHFVFYKLNDKVKFYLMLLSDSTKSREEEEMQNRQLSEALDAAVRSNESRIRFFSNISHVLRTPLNGILGFAELASQETDTEKIRSYVSKIASSGNALLARINDLLDMSLIVSGTLKLEYGPADIAKVAVSVTDKLSDARHTKDITVNVDTSGIADRRVICDANRVSQILVRLIENSILFAPEHGSINLTVLQVSENGRWVYLFSVKNKGQSIPDEIADRIFEPEAWNTNKVAGDVSEAGVEMAVVKALIDLMGGDAAVINENDGTVIFEIRLPLEVAQEERKPEETAVGPLRLLVVDDNEINREIAQLMLESEGHTVELAENGAEAVEKVKAANGGYDVVFMDVQMPVMNGYEATAAIRALPDEAVSSVPIIAMTANAYQEDRDNALNAGMNGYVTKPIDPDSIRAALISVSGR